MTLSFCPPQRLYVLSLSALCLSLVGCAASVPFTGSLSGGQLRGSIHGGQQPVSGASVQLYAAGITGYGSAATALLSSAVTTDGSGAFTIPAGYTCPSSTSQLYIVATGGNPGLAAGTDNPALAEMAALGPCSLHDGQYTLDPNSFISMSEVTTVASVYALSAFMGGDATHLGTSSTNATGLANSFQMVNNLVSTTTGGALSTTPAGNGTPPQTTVDTLANILSACVNSDGTGTPCSGLFAAATPSGGTAPTDTIQAIYDIARNPANNVSALYGLPNASPPFQPALTAVPNDWILAVTYTASALDANAMAIDAGGNVWFTNNVYGTPASVTELSSTGAVLSGANGYAGGGLSLPQGIAIDLLGHAWVSSSGNVVEFSSNGSILSGTNGYTGGGLTTPTAIAIDGLGNAWMTDTGSVIELDSSGNVLSGTNGFKTGATSAPLGVAIDSSEDAWVTNGTDHTVTEFDKNGNVISGTGYAVTGLTPAAIAFDLHGDAWVNTQYPSGTTNLNNVGKLSSTGSQLSPSNGYANCVSGRYLFGVYGNCLWWVGDAFALDGAGDVWSNAAWYTGPGGLEYFASSVAEISNTGTILSGADGLTGSTLLSSPGTFGDVTGVKQFAIDSGGDVWILFEYGTPAEFVGAATPVTTPFSVGIKNGTLGARP